MNCTAGSSGLHSRVSEFLSQPLPGSSSSYMDDPSPEYAGRRPSKGGRKSQPRRSIGAAPSADLSLTTLAVRRRSSEDEDDLSSHSIVATNMTRVQASKSSAKIILDDNQTGYLAVVPPDIETDLMKYTVPARDGTIGPRPIKASMLFEFDYRPKISSLLPHESHKEISAHLNIAWKSIGQDILQLYKDLAKKVEHKLKVLNGEISEYNVRAVSKRKAGDISSRRTSREPPANSGLRRCNCRPDCPKYKIIPGSDLEKRWRSRFNRGDTGEKTVMLDSTGSSSDMGIDFPSTSTSGPILFGGQRGSNPGVAPQIRYQGQDEADELPDALLPESFVQQRGSETSFQQQYSAMDANASRPDTPMDIAMAAAVAANVDQNAIYYTMPQMDPHQQQFQQQLQQQQQQQQQMIYHPGHDAAFSSPPLPYIDPHNQEQMAQLQGSYILPNGIIVNAFGQEIARTLPPSEFANLVASSSSAPATPAVSEEGGSMASPAAALETAVDGVDIDGTDAVAASSVSTEIAMNAPEGGVSLNEDPQDGTGAGAPSATVEAQMGMELVNGEIAKDHDTVNQGEIAANDIDVPSTVETEVTGDNAMVGEPIAAASSAMPESPVIHSNATVATATATTVQSPEDDQPFVWHQVQETPGRKTPPEQLQSPPFNWHQVQAAEGNEVPASQASSSDDRKNEEKKEKMFALQAGLGGIETESNEMAELKAGENASHQDAPQPILDPRQEFEEEVDEKAELKASRAGEEEEEEDDDEDAAEEKSGENKEEKEQVSINDMNEEEEDEREDGEIMEEEEKDDEVAVPVPLACVSAADFRMHNLTASDYDDAIDVQNTEAENNDKNFLDDSRAAE